MTIISFTPSQPTGQVGVVPGNAKLVTTDSLATITTAGYLNNQASQGFSISPTDIFDVIYDFNTATKQGTYAVFTISISNSVITMVEWGNPGTVVLPTIANHIAVFNDTLGTIESDVATAINGGNLQAGLSGTAGYLASFPATGSKGSLRVTAVASTGDTVTTLSNVAMGQATTVSISDPGASIGYLNTSSVNASLTPVGAFITKDVTLTAAALATSGHVAIITGSGSMQFKVRNIKMNYSASGLSGGGGNRLVTITDGTTVFNNAGITAALLGTPVNTEFGGTGNPVAGTVAQNTSTVAGASVYAVYSGGTTDYTTGSVVITVALERVA